MTLTRTGKEENMARKLPFQGNGHLTSIADGELATVFEIDGKDLAEITASYPDSRFLTGPFIPGLGYGNCGTCDEQLVLQVTDDAIEASNPCPYPDGITTVITLAVPSGKVIVTDDLRPSFYSLDDARMASYNTALGQHQYILAMAASGCAYGPVGNTCPGLYRTGESTYAIASPGYNRDSDRTLVPAGWEQLAGIITGLWAYSIADYADWESRGGDPASLGWGDTIVDIPPGTYQFTHHAGERSFDRDASGTVIFTNIKYLGMTRTQVRAETAAREGN